MGSDVTYELNIKSRHKASRKFHRNSLKPYIEVNHMHVRVATGLEGNLPLPNLPARCNPSTVIPYST